MIKRIIFTAIIVLLNYSIFASELKQREKLKNIIYTYIIEQNYEMAVESAKQYIEKFPKDCEGYRLLGFIYEKEQKINLAIATYTRFAKIDKCNLLNFYAGKLAFLDGKYKLAVLHLTKLVKNNKVDAGINKLVFYKTLGESYFFLNDYISAVDNLRKCIKYNPYDVEVYDFISNAYANDGRKNYSNAYRQIKNLIIKNKRFKKNTFNFQVALIFLGNREYNDAIQYFKKIELEYNNDYKYNFDFGLAYLLNNDSDRAITYISKAIEIYSNKFSLKKIVLNLLKLNRQIAKYYIVLSVAYNLNGYKKAAKIAHEKVKKYSPGIYKKYTFEVIKNKHSKLYKELPDMWEYHK